MWHCKLLQTVKMVIRSNVLPLPAGSKLLMKCDKQWLGSRGVCVIGEEGKGCVCVCRDGGVNLWGQVRGQWREVCQLFGLQMLPP